MRLDKYISENHNCTRNRAQFFIEQGLVLVNGMPAKKASQDIEGTDLVRLLEDRRIEFVSRSAIKLDSFLDQIGLDVSGMICLDIGASTGGFTQVLLMRDARQVYTVDVGTLQLHPSIRSDSRVICTENTDIRDFNPPLLLWEGLGERWERGSYFDLIVGDISFISLTKLMDSILALANSGTEIILLYKPQFEVGPEYVNKSGVVRDEKRIIRKLAEFQEILTGKNVRIKKLSPSAIDGEAGNREHLIWIQKKES